MRVLWLSATPGLGADLLGLPPAQGGGWVASLEGALRQRDDLELSIAFPWKVREVEELRDGRRQYLPFPAYPRGCRLRRLLAEAACRLEPPGDVDYLERAVELAQPDLIHVWGTEAFFGRVAERTEVPVLVEIQGLRNPCAEAYCAELTPFELLRFGSGKRLVNGRSLLHTYHRYRRSAVRELGILGPARFVSGRTDWDRSVCAALAPRARYFHCDRVLRDDFYDGRWGGRSASGPLRLVSTLRGNAYKGFVTVARCAALLQGLLPDGFRWTLIGVRPGEEIHRVVERKLGASFASLGLELVGRQPAAEVVRRLEGSDLYVQPSCIENSPNGLCEAMLVGLPAVSTRVGGVPSLLDHGREGLLVPPSDPWAMAGAIRRLAEDPTRAAELGRAAAERARQRHDRAAVAERVAEIYRQVHTARTGGAAAGAVEG